MTASELTPGASIWIKQKNKLEYILAEKDSDKQVQVAVMKVQKVRNFFGLLFKVDNLEKLIFVEKHETILA